MQSGLLVIEISRQCTYIDVCMYVLSCMQPYKVNYFDKNGMHSIRFIGTDKEFLQWNTYGCVLPSSVLYRIVKH